MVITDAQKTDLGLEPEPGIYANVPFHEYLLWPYLSKSALRSFEISPAQYQLELAKPFIPSDAMILGSMVDTLWFEGSEAFESAYASAAPDLARKSGKRWQTFEQMSEASGQVPVLSHQYDKAKDMVKALSRHDGAARALESGTSQLSLVWDDPATGIRMKGRPDLVDFDFRRVDDLKTARDNTPAGFSRACGDYNYHWQGRHYLTALETLTGEVWDGGFRLITVRNTPVHGVQIYRMHDDALALAERELAEVFARFRSCLITNHWPAGSESDLVVNLKGWRYKR